MAKGQDLSRHQRGIVNRYYEHRDTIALQKLGEIVSELYLCDGDKAAQRLWKRAETALANLKLEPKKIDPIMASRDVQGLAKLLQELA